MTPEDIEKIYSNDYADFFISYYGNPLVLEQYKNSAVTIINFFYAIIHVPVSQMTEDIISKMGYAAVPTLFGLVSDESLEASGILRLRNVPSFDLRGKGVLIGIVDSGIDYTNPIFQYADKTTKISSIWDQTVISDKIPEGMAYGTEYTREQINEALKSEDPFSIVPTKDEVGHGTIIAGIAAGNEVPESGFYGVAPDAELVIVKLKPAKPYLKAFFRIPENALSYQENDIIFGFQYLINYATKVNKPIVICIAIDTAQYARDGRGTTSSWLSLHASNVGIAILIPVGNEGNARRHYYGVINENVGYNTVELNVGPNESGFSMEIWGASPNTISLDILSPSGEYIPRAVIRLNETRKITFIFEATIIYVDYQMVERQSGDQLILLRFTKPSQGVWKFKVYGRGIYPVNFNIWLPMNNYITADTYFIRSDPYITLLSLACASTPITVTAYNTKDGSLYIDAGRGYTRIDLIKPDIAAPGVNILSPSLDHSFVDVTGTSAAVAHTAGVAAILLEWGIVNGNYPRMSTQNIKIFMIRGAQRDANIQYPNREWGYGILDIYNIFDSIRRGL
ncbi:MAG: S8 family peptidase [Mobilitalea sp.]